MWPFVHAARAAGSSPLACRKQSAVQPRATRATESNVRAREREHLKERERERGRAIHVCQVYRRCKHCRGTMVSCAVLMAVAGMAMLGSSTTSAFTASPTSIRSQHSRAAARPSCDHAASTQAPSRHPAAAKAGGRRNASPLRMSTAEETPAAAAAVAREPTRDIPTTLPSECGIDYVPLATMLATGDLKGADQFTRDALIKAAGAGSQKRDFVYWTEVKNIPK